MFPLSFKVFFTLILDNEVLLMSETDFTISTKKIKSDPFFKKLLYIQNKTPSIGTVLAIDYDCTIK